MSQGVTSQKRRAIYRATAKALASLHSANVDSIGLGNYGRRNDYCKRQVNYFIWLSMVNVIPWILFFKEIYCIRIESWTQMDAIRSYYNTIKFMKMNVAETLKRLSSPFGSLKSLMRHLSLPFPMPIYWSCYCTGTQKEGLGSK